MKDWKPFTVKLFRNLQQRSTPFEMKLNNDKIISNTEYYKSKEINSYNNVKYIREKLNFNRYNSIQKDFSVLTCFVAEDENNFDNSYLWQIINALSSNLNKEQVDKVEEMLLEIEELIKVAQTNIIEESKTYLTV
jgi:hypothetical protein